MAICSQSKLPFCSVTIVELGDEEGVVPTVDVEPSLTLRVCVLLQPLDSPLNVSPEPKCMLPRVVVPINAST
jgi:hypothetical protein